MKQKIKCEYSYLAALWILAFVPLVVLRSMSFKWHSVLNIFFACTWIVTGCFWVIHYNNNPFDEFLKIKLKFLANWKKLFFVVIFFGILIYFQFYQLAGEHWWSGTDETLAMAIRDPWYQVFEDLHARPLAGAPLALASLLTPNSFSGYLILNSIFRFSITVILYGIFFILYEENNTLAMGCAILFLISPTESIRYIDTAIMYYSPMFFMTLAAWLFLYSYKNCSRILLLCSMLSVAVTLLQYESPLLLFGALPLLLIRDKQPYIIVWTVILYATCLLFGLRLIQHILFDNLIYQSMIIGTRPDGILGWLQRIGTNTLTLAVTTSRYVQVTSSQLAQFFRTAILPVVLIAGFITISAWKDNQLPNISWCQIAWCLIALFLIILPHTPLELTAGGLEDFTADGTMRLGMFTSVIQAVFVTILLLFIANRVKKAAKPVFISLVVLISFCSMVHNFAYQARGGNWNSYLTFDKSARLYRALHMAMPEDRQGANAFFVILPEDEPSHFGWSYSLYHAGCSFYSMPGYHGRLTLDGKLEQRYMTGYPDTMYVPVPDYDFIVFRALPGQEKVELVSMPVIDVEKPAKPGPPCFTPPLPMKNGKLPYFDEEYYPYSRK